MNIKNNNKRFDIVLLKKDGYMYDIIYNIQK